MLTDKDRAELASKLRAQRRALFATVADLERDLAFIGEDRESELEERAQEERAARLAARLEDRGKRELEEIDAALRRLAERRYGNCVRCQEAIPLGRLRAIPATLHCVDCAQALPEAAAEPESEAPAARAAALPADLGLLSDRELGEALWEQIRADGRIDTDELRLVCRKGMVHLSGAVPSEAEHREILKLLTDVNGLTEIDDRLRVNELLWEREGRSRAATAASPETLAALGQRREISAVTTTSDIAESREEDVEFVPPAGPPADEE